MRLQIGKLYSGDLPNPKTLANICEWFPLSYSWIFHKTYTGVLDLGGIITTLHQIHLFDTRGMSMSYSLLAWQPLRPW